MSQARNEGIKIAKGEYLYFFDPDDYIEPRTLEILYNTAIESNSDCVQFNYKVIDSESKECFEGRNGDQETGVLDKNRILKEMLPQYIGYSANSIKNYGSMDFYKNKEMCSVWRFLYRRSIITDYKICFPKSISLGEDALFNCRFFCYAKRLRRIDDVLYTYFLKNCGAMFTLLKNPDALVYNKINGAEERHNIRELYKNELAIDIFPLYAGSLFLSAVELATKLSNAKDGMKSFIEYTKKTEVREAFSIIPLKGNIKVKIILFLFKLKMFKLTFILIYCANQIGLKLQ